MFETIKQSLEAWNGRHSERAKLQHTYIIVAGALLLVAGVLGLLNRELGQNILAISVFLAAIFLTNAVAWSLLQSAIIMRLPDSRPKSRRK